MTETVKFTGVGRPYNPENILSVEYDRDGRLSVHYSANGQILGGLADEANVLFPPRFGAQRVSAGPGRGVFDLNIPLIAEILSTDRPGSTHFILHDGACIALPIPTMRVLEYMDAHDVSYACEDAQGVGSHVLKKITPINVGDFEVTPPGPRVRAGANDMNPHRRRCSFSVIENSKG